MGAVKLRCLLWFHRWEFYRSRSLGGGREMRTYRCARCAKVTERRVRL
jgi:hypothetical protein